MNQKKWEIEMKEKKERMEKKMVCSNKIEYNSIYVNQ